MLRVCLTMQIKACLGALVGINRNERLQDKRHHLLAMQGSSSMVGPMLVLAPSSDQ